MFVIQSFVKRKIIKFFQTVCYSLSCRDQVSRSTYQEPTVYIQHYNMHANSNFFEEKVTETKPLPCRNKYYHFKSKIDCFAIKTFCRQSHEPFIGHACTNQSEDGR